ncbi:hypothetical protein [Rubrivirga sp. IMCC43871]|uniref:hypothetical protein n=1 Tax=Rubrivirga sp. IMCC43871 TaxID=3391575 RepID=UPI00398F9A04
MMTGLCTNDIDPCDHHVARTPHAVAEGADFVCPECGFDLMPVSADGPSLLRDPRARIAALVVVALGVLGGGGFAGARALGLVGPSPPPSVAVGDEASIPPDSLALAPPSTPPNTVDQSGPPAPPDDSVDPEPRAVDPSVPPETPPEPSPEVVERIVERPVYIDRPVVVERPAARPPPAPARDCSGYARRITQLTVDECPALRDADRSSACYTEIERLRSEFSICQGG